MTTSFFASADTGFSASADLFVSAYSSASADSIIPSLSVGLLLSVILDMTKAFYIGKSVTSANNITVTKILKGII